LIKHVSSLKATCCRCKVVDHTNNCLPVVGDNVKAKVQLSDSSVAEHHSPSS